MNEEKIMEQELSTLPKKPKKKGTVIWLLAGACALCVILLVLLLWKGNLIAFR